MNPLIDRFGRTIERAGPSTPSASPKESPYTIRTIDAFPGDTYVVYGGAAYLPQVTKAMEGLEIDPMIPLRKLVLIHREGQDQKDGAETVVDVDDHGISLRLTRWTAMPVTRMGCSHAQYLKMMRRGLKNGETP